MLEIGKTYRHSMDTTDFYVLSKLPTDIKAPDYDNYAIYIVDRVTKATTPGETAIHRDAYKDITEVKE